MSNSFFCHHSALLPQVVQQGKLGDGVEIQVLELSDSDSDDAGAPSGAMKKWRSSTWVRGTEYSWIHTAVKKKTVLHEAAAKLLELLVPGR